MFTIQMPAVPSRFAWLFKPRRQSTIGSSAATAARETEVESDESVSSDEETDLGTETAVAMPPANPTAIEELLRSRPTLVEPSHVLPKPTQQDIAKLGEFLGFAVTILELCRRIASISDAIQSIAPTTRGYRDIIRSQSIHFIELTLQLRSMSMSTIGAFTLQKLSKIRSVSSMGIADEHRLQSEFFTHFTQCKYLGLTNYSETFEKIVGGILKMVELLYRVSVDNDVYNFFEFDSHRVTESYMPRLVIESRVNFDLLHTLFSNSLLYGSKEEMIHTICEEMFPADF